MLDFDEALEWSVQAIDRARDEGGAKSLLASLLITIVTCIGLAVGLFLLCLYVVMLFKWPLAMMCVTVFVVVFIAAHIGF